MNAAQDGSDAAAQGRLVKAGELARRTGLTRQALHVYVQMGLLEPAGTTQGGQRLFDEAAEGRVRSTKPTRNPIHATEQAHSCV